MKYIEQIAYNLGKRDEVPNQDLAKILAEKNAMDGIKEIISYLDDKNKSIQSDCIKVIYEIGYIKPELISEYVDKYIDLLSSKNNRMVWGGMIALSTIAHLKPAEIWKHKNIIINKIETGSVITNVAGVKTIIGISKSPNFYKLTKDLLFNLQKECRNVDFTKRAEDMIDVIESTDLSSYIQILENRLPNLSTSAQKRLKRLITKTKDNYNLT